MKANASTNTPFETLEHNKIYKKLSLQKLFTPSFRFQLLLEKALIANNNKSILNSNENHIDFANKSIFIRHYKKRKFINDEDKKSESAKNINYSKLNINKKNNLPFVKRILSINDINNGNAKNVKLNNIQNKFHKLTIKSTTNSRNSFIQSANTEKKQFPPFPFKNIDNFSNVKKKLYFGSEKKVNDIKEKPKYKLINSINNKHNYFWINRKRKNYKFKAIKLFENS